MPAPFRHGALVFGAEGGKRIFFGIATPMPYTAAWPMVLAGGIAWAQGLCLAVCLVRAFGSGLGHGAARGNRVWVSTDA